MSTLKVNNSNYKFLSFEPENRSLVFCCQNSNSKSSPLKFIQFLPQKSPALLIDRVQPEPSTPHNAVLSPLVLSSNSVIGMFSSQVRKTFDSSNIIYGTKNSEALAAIGLTTGFNLVAGALTVKSALEDFGNTTDKTSRVSALLKLATGGLLTAGGALYIPVRALTLIALATASDVARVAAGVLGTAGSFCFNVISLLAAIGSGIKLRELAQFRQMLTVGLPDLKALISVSDLEKEAIRQKEKYKALSPLDRQTKVAEKVEKLLKKKEAFIKRVTDDKCLEMIRNNDPGALEAVQKKLKENTILTSISMGFSTTSVVVSIAACIFVAPTAVVIIAALGVVLTGAMFIFEAYQLLQQFMEQEPGRFDKLWIAFSTITAVGAFALVCLFETGLIPIIAAALVGVVWMGINAACYFNLTQKNSGESSCPLPS